MTDGNTRIIRLGKLSIRLKKTTPKNMATAGRVSGLVIQALRYIGHEHMDNSLIAVLKRRLSEQLMKDIRYAPAWIGDIFKELNS